MNALTVSSNDDCGSGGGTWVVDWKVGGWAWWDDQNWFWACEGNQEGYWLWAWVDVPPWFFFQEKLG
jgi:hypothetical protein